MRGWEEKRLKDIVNGFFDGPHATPKEAASGAIFLGIKNVTEDGRLDFSNIRYIAWEDMPKWTKRVLPSEGDIVFSYEATLHRYAMIPPKFQGCLGRRMALLRINEKVANNKFILYYFQSPFWRKEVEKNTLTGATVDRVPLTNVPNFRVQLPSLNTQRRIASILSSYDDLIENNLKRIKLLEEVAQRTYEEWFVKFRVNGEALAIDEETGLPEGWERKKLKDVLNLNYGKALKADERINGCFPVFGSSGIIGSHNSYLVEGPGIIVGRKGNVGSVFWTEKNYYPIDTVYYVRSEISQLFLYFNLKNQNFINSDAAVPGLNRNAAYMSDSFLPTIPVLESFDKVIKPIFRNVENLQNQNHLLEQSRDILLPRLMNGTISITGAEENFAMAAEAEAIYELSK